MGFIFSHVTEHFLKSGWDVSVIDNFTKGSHPELVAPFTKQYENFTCYNKDVSYEPIIKTIEMIDPHYIIHAAAISDVDASIANPSKVIRANDNATLNAFEAARRCKRLKKFMYVSTDEVYGECDHPKTEDEIIFPKNPYALSKAVGSLMRLTYDNTYSELRDKTCETRFCNVFGPRQDDRKIIPAIKRALNGGAPVSVHNKGEGYRQYIYVDAIPPLVEKILFNGNRTYNITAGEGHTVSELIALAEQVTGRPVPTVAGKRKGMDMRYDMSNARLKEDLGIDTVSEFPFEDAFRKYLLDQEA